MAQMESAANQPKEAPVAPREALRDASQRLTVAQAELKAEQAKMPAGLHVNDKGELVKDDATKEESLSTRIYNYLMGNVEAGGYVPSTASQDVKAMAAPFVPLTNLVKGPNDTGPK